jgi:hypothetical protein
MQLKRMKEIIKIKKIDWILVKLIKYKSKIALSNPPKVKKIKK